MTHKFQPLDINVNGVAKSFLKDRFQKWYTEEIQKQTNDGKGVYEVDIDTRLSRMKSIHARWIIGLYDKLRNSQQLIDNGFRAVSITEALDPQSDLEMRIHSNTYCKTLIEYYAIIKVPTPIQRPYFCLQLLCKRPKFVRNKGKKASENLGSENKSPKS